MNKTTAIRSFANSGYTPARKDVARILDSKYYLVTLQDYETDQGDGHYLLNTQQTFVLSGHDARQERDSRMNRCNRIVEYIGPVYQLCNEKDPFYARPFPLFTSQAAALAHFDKTWAAHMIRRQHTAVRCQKQLDTPRTERAAQTKARYPLITPEHLDELLDQNEQDCKDTLAAYQKIKPVPNVKQLR